MNVASVTVNATTHGLIRAGRGLADLPGAADDGRDATAVAIAKCLLSEIDEK
jgi:hypothetical protein